MGHKDDYWYLVRMIFVERQMTQLPNNLDFEYTSDEFRVAVQGCGMKVEIDPDGNVTVYSRRPVAMLPPKATTDASTVALKIGTKMPDGSIYAGVSPDMGKPMYAAPEDAPMHCDFNQAAHFAAYVDACGCKDWRVPTKAELNVLFQNREAIGGFDTTGSALAGWYWSSSDIFDYDARAQRFSDGIQIYRRRDFASALRCVRG